MYLLLVAKSNDLLLLWNEEVLFLFTIQIVLHNFLESILRNSNFFQFLFSKNLNDISIQTVLCKLVRLYDMLTVPFQRHSCYTNLFVRCISPLAEASLEHHSFSKGCWCWAMSLTSLFFWNISCCHLNASKHSIFITDAWGHCDFLVALIEDEVIQS